MSKKVIEGWFAIAADQEYGPELVLYKGKSQPTEEPKTWCCGLDDSGITGEEETNYVSLIDETGLGTDKDKPFKKLNYYKLRIEILEEKEPASFVKGEMKNES